MINPICWPLGISKTTLVSTAAWVAVPSGKGVTATGGEMSKLLRLQEGPAARSTQAEMAAPHARPATRSPPLKTVEPMLYAPTYTWD